MIVIKYFVFTNGHSKMVETCQHCYSDEALEFLRCFIAKQEQVKPTNIVFAFTNRAEIEEKTCI